MNQNTLKLTRRGKQHLENKLSNLNKELISLKEEIRMAITVLGVRDSQYHLLNREKGEILHEISQIEDILQHSDILPKGVVGEAVELGNRVKLQNHKYCYDVRIVSTVEANPLERMVSDISPIGLSVIGRKLGETVMITTPAGAIEFLIKEIT